VEKQKPRIKADAITSVAKEYSQICDKFEGACIAETVLIDYHQAKHN
jgi:hypothetical protein